MRLGYSVQDFRADRLQPGQTEVVFVESDARAQFEAAARSAGLAAREIFRFPTLYSRKGLGAFRAPRCDRPGLARSLPHSVA